MTREEKIEQIKKYLEEFKEDLKAIADDGSCEGVDCKGIRCNTFECFSLLFDYIAVRHTKHKCPDCKCK